VRPAQRAFRAGRDRHVGVHRAPGWNAEDGLDLVAGELQDEPTMAADGALHRGDRRAEALRNFFGGRRFDPSGEVAQIREQNRDLAQPAVPWLGPLKDLVTDLPDEPVERVLDSEQDVGRQHGAILTHEPRHPHPAGFTPDMPRGAGGSWSTEVVIDRSI